MAHAARDAPPERLVQRFEETFGRLWRRAHVTLGSITLTAIVDRVVCTASEQHEVLSSLKAEPTGLRFEEFRERATSVPPDQLADAIRFVLAEFLTILGDLTAEILSPALHAELSNSAARKAPS